MKISLEKFIEKTKGTRVDVPWVNEPSKLKGQCVSLVQTYLQECLEQPAKARGNAKDWIQSYVNEGLGVIVDTPRKGDLLVFSNEANGYGHIAIYVDENTLYDQNNLRHDNGNAGYGNIFTNDYVILRPNVELVEEPKNDIKYLNLNADITDWNVYPMNVAPVSGNECFEIMPSKFGGLSYTIKGYTMENVAIIETRDYGQVQIYIGPETKGKYSITDKPLFGLVK